MLINNNLSERVNQSKVTPDGSILKITLTPGKGSPKTWPKGSKAELSYKSYSFSEPKEHPPEHKHNVCTHPYPQDSCSHTDADPSKPLKILVGDTSLDRTPFSLRLGLQFSTPFFETCLATMSIGEEARFLIMPDQQEGYVSLEKTLRDARETERTGKVKRSSNCCMGQIEAMESGENTDLASMHLSPLEITIHLKAVLIPGQFEKQVWEMSNTERLISAPTAKSQGVQFYINKDYASASERFARAVMLLESISVSNDVQDAQRERKREADVAKEAARRKRLDDLQRLGHGSTPSPTIHHESVEVPLPLDTSALYTLLQTSRLNYAASRLKLGDYATTIRQTSEVLQRSREYEIDGDVVWRHRSKAFFRRAQAYRGVNSELELAASDLRLCRVELAERLKRAVGDESTSIRVELAEVEKEADQVDKLIKEREEKERALYSRIFT